jgi:hypothetical protein
MGTWVHLRGSSVGWGRAGRGGGGGGGRVVAGARVGVHTGRRGRAREERAVRR